MNKLICSVLLLLSAFLGFWYLRPQGSDDPVGPVVDYLDPEIKRWDNMGYLGGESHVATKNIAIDDPRNEGEILSPGGIVLRKIEAGSLLAKNGFAVGDVIVRVNELWLPNNQNPLLDFFDLIEKSISAAKGRETKISVFREGTLQEKMLPLDLPALEEGFPESCLRWKNAGLRALEFLATCVSGDASIRGCPDDKNAKLSLSSLCGLAFLCWNEDEAEKNSRFEKPLEILTAHVLKCLDDEIKAESPDYSATACARAAIFLVEAGEGISDKMDLLKKLAYLTDRIQNLQQDDGAWEADEKASYNEKTLPANLCLQALGMLERAGVQLSNEKIEKAIVWLKANTNDGKPAFLTVPNFSVPAEAGRSASAAQALILLRVDESDKFFLALSDYHEDFAADIAKAETAMPFHLMNSCLLNRHWGSAGIATFHYNNKLALLLPQRMNGEFLETEKNKSFGSKFYGNCLCPAWTTAHYAITLLMNDQNLPFLQGRNALGKPLERDGEGKIKTEMAGPAKPKNKAEALKKIDEAIRMMLSMGIPEDDEMIKMLRKEREKLLDSK